MPTTRGDNWYPALLYLRVDAARGGGVTQQLPGFIFEGMDPRRFY